MSVLQEANELADWAEAIELSAQIEISHILQFQHLPPKICFAIGMYIYIAHPLFISRTSPP